MDVGVVAIKGLKSNHYLAIKKNGVLYGAVSFSAVYLSDLSFLFNMHYSLSLRG